MTRFLLEFLPPPSIREPARPNSHTWIYHLSSPGNKTGSEEYLLRKGRRTVARSLDRRVVLEALEHDLQHTIAEHAKRRVFVHAGVVAWKGAAILVPGRSRSGKSSLVAALVRQGATYYSDEYAVLDPRGRVHPYPRRMALREPRPLAHGLPRRITAQSLEGRVGVSPLPVALVLVTRYRKGAIWRPRVLSAGAGVLALIENTVAVRRQPEESLATLRNVVAGARILAGPRADARRVAARILHALTKSR